MKPNLIIPVQLINLTMCTYIRIIACTPLSVPIVTSRTNNQQQFIQIMVIQEHSLIFINKRPEKIGEYTNHLMWVVRLKKRQILMMVAINIKY